jgi:formylglycine-generating enzyme required for sulfatase activity
VARFPANAWGLHDVHGLVWEWCSDHWLEELSSAVVEGEPWLDPFGIDAPHGTRHVMRGGSWASSAEQCAFAFRSNGGHPCRRLEPEWFSGVLAAAAAGAAHGGA